MQVEVLSKANYGEYNRTQLKIQCIPNLVTDFQKAHISKLKRFIKCCLFGMTAKECLKNSKLKR